MKPANCTLPGRALRSAAVAAIMSIVAVNAPDAAAQSRGELLYTTHCIACHSAQVHWRDQKLVTDWTSLKTQVQRWQQVNSLGWSPADVVDVARYLNNVIYRVEKNAEKLSVVVPPASDRPR